MTDTMTTPDATLRERAERFLALAEKATPGPWRAMHEGNQYVRTGYLPTATLVAASRVEGPRRPWNPHAAIASGLKAEDHEVVRFAVPDAEFVEASRNDAPDIIRDLLALSAVGWIYDPDSGRDKGPVQLLVKGGKHPTEDAEQWRTVGFYQDGDDDAGWNFAGWCWEHDHYVHTSDRNGGAQVIAWAPLLPPSASPAPAQATEGELLPIALESEVHGHECPYCRCLALVSFADAIDKVRCVSCKRELYISREAYDAANTATPPAEAREPATEGETLRKPRFEKTGCSQCGREFGPGDHGYSHCDQHQPPELWIPDLIRNDYDKAPDHYAAGDNWDDGADEIARKIVERFADRATPAPALVERAPDDRLFNEVESIIAGLSMLLEAVYSGDDYGQLRIRVQDLLKESRAILAALPGAATEKDDTQKQEPT